MLENDKFDVAQNYKKVLVYRAQSRYPFILYDTLLDIYNDTTLCFIRNYDEAQLDKPSMVYTYLWTTFINGCKKWIRDTEDALNKGICLSLDEVSEYSDEDGRICIKAVELVDDPYIRLEEAQHSNYVYGLILQGLPITLRLIAHMYYIEEMKLTTIMKELQIPNLDKMARLFKRTRKLLALRLMEIKALRKDGLL